jgi:hypothetical protein
MSETNPCQPASGATSISESKNKPRILGTALVTLIILTSPVPLLIAAGQVMSYSSSYIPGLSPFIFAWPFVLGVAFFAYYFTRDSKFRRSLQNHCITATVSLLLVVMVFDYFNSKEQAKLAGNTNAYENRDSVDNAKVVSYGPFTRTFALSFKGRVTKTVVVKRSFGKFKGSLPFTASWPESSYSSTDKFSFNALNIFAWELQR